jgi:hypothetical protein
MGYIMKLPRGSEKDCVANRTKQTNEQGSYRLRLETGVTSDKAVALILLKAFLFLALSANAIGPDSQQQVEYPRGLNTQRSHAELSQLETNTLINYLSTK